MILCALLNIVQRACVCEVDPQTMSVYPYAKLWSEQLVVGRNVNTSIRNGLACRTGNVLAA